MGHDSELYQVNVGHMSPAETKATELAQQESARNKFQQAAREESRVYAGFVGQPDSYVPVLSSISPNTKANSTGAFTLTCTGSNFNEDSKVFWGTTELATTYVSATSLTAAVPASAIASAGTVQVSVKTDSSASVNRAFTIT